MLERERERDKKETHTDMKRAVEYSLEEMMIAITGQKTGQRHQLGTSS